jgi:hypothetical protein
VCATTPTKEAGVAMARSMAHTSQEQAVAHPPSRAERLSQRRSCPLRSPCGASVLVGEKKSTPPVVPGTRLVPQTPQNWIKSQQPDGGAARRGSHPGR